MGEKRDNEDGSLSKTHLFLRVLGYKRRSDIRGVDITGFRVYNVY